MGLRVAIASGNWSNPTTWNGGVLPGPGDIVASNNFTVTIDQNVNVDSITNAAQAVVGAVPNMTSNTTPSGVVTASQSETGTFAAFNAFGGDFNTEWRPTTAATISYEFTSPKAIDQYSVGAYLGATPSWTFQGWNGSTWVTIHTVTSSATGYTSPLLGNSTTYIKYRLNYASDPGRVHTIQFYEYLGTSAAIAGGTFNLNSGVTVTCTNAGDGIYNVAGTICLDYVGTSGSSTINANIRGRDGTTVFCIRKSGTGTLNINGTLRGLFSSNANGGALQITGTGTVNITGNIQDPSNGGQTVQVDVTSTLNIVGSIYSGYYNGQQTVRVNASSCVISIVGNIYVVAGGATNWGVSAVQFNNSNTTLNLTGDIIATDGNSSSKAGLGVTGANCIIQHTGNIIGSSDNVAGGTAFTTSQVIYYNQVGYIKASMSGPGFVSSNASAINLSTGPFISSIYGFFPYQVIRMHLIPTTNSYFEFRDETTNGAVQPGAIAPATQMISPSGVSDSPTPANVRYGISYANGSLVGTLRIPNVNSVAYGVQVDNTVGSAVLTPQSIWDFAIASLNTSGSIGERLKKVSTVDSTGAQLSSFEF